MANLASETKGYHNHEKEIIHITLVVHKQYFPIQSKSSDGGCPIREANL
jgi:hypothetical protein